MKLTLFWKRVILPLLLIYSTYHLVRDFFQDILNIHSPLTEIFHYQMDTSLLPPFLKWTRGAYRQWLTFPIEILLLLSTPFALRNNKVTCIDYLIFFICLLTLIFWFSGYYYIILSHD